MRDGNGPWPLLPPGEFSEFDSSKAPRDNAGSFLIGQGLAAPMFGDSEPDSHLDYFKHPLYDRYMRLPKGLLSPDDTNVLQEVHEGLVDENASRFLFVSGWAAAEAAIVMWGVRNNKRVRERLVDGAASAWLRAHDRVMAVAKRGQETEDHYSLKERIELALASIPLLEDLIAGDVRVKTLKSVTESYIQTGIDNIAFGQEKRKDGDETRAQYHDGLSWEILAPSVLNLELSTRRFGMTATARNDSGYRDPKLTHDIMLFKQRGGQLESMLPAEIKTHVTRQHRKRYKALIIDSGFMDVLKAGEPGPMINMLARVYRDDASKVDMLMAQALSAKMWTMVGQYSSGAVLDIGNKRSVLQFHDASQVRLGSYALRGALTAA